MAARTAEARVNQLSSQEVSSDRERLLRRVYENQVVPAIEARLDWLTRLPLRDRLSRRFIIPSQLADHLLFIHGRLEEAIYSPENRGRRVSIVLSERQAWQPELYWKRGDPNFAAQKLLNILQGEEVPLRLGPTWEEISGIMEKAGGTAPIPEEEIIDNHSAGQYDRTILMGVSLPTRIPFVYVDYYYRVSGDSKGEGEPTVSTYPQRVDLVVERDRT